MRKHVRKQKEKEARLLNKCITNSDCKTFLSKRSRVLYAMFVSFYSSTRNSFTRTNESKHETGKPRNSVRRTLIKDSSKMQKLKTTSLRVGQNVFLCLVFILRVKLNLNESLVLKAVLQNYSVTFSKRSVTNKLLNPLIWKAPATKLTCFRSRYCNQQNVPVYLLSETLFKFVDF